MEIVREDQRYVWHPYTQAKSAPAPLPIAKGLGTLLYDSSGRSYIDANSSWWVNLHGHSHPYINEKIKEQLDKLEHVIFTDFTHEPAVELSKRLIHLAPAGFDKVFFTDNGSTANESALKIAMQFWHNQGSRRKRVICFNNGYHGDTFGAMSSSGRTQYNKPFQPYLFETSAIDPPQAGNEEVSIMAMKALLEKGDAACFIFEPLIQGPGGMRTYSREGLNELIKLCKSYEAITIADEVMTGFGRTGPLFACEYLQVQPDMITISKGITGGYLPLGATLCCQKLYEGFLSEDRSKSLLHGHSYCGNPLACAAALASLDLLTAPACAQKRASIESAHTEFLRKVNGHPMIKRCEVLGTIFVLEYQPPDAAAYFSSASELIKSFFLKNKIIVRPLGNVFYINSPYCITESEMSKIYSTLELTLERPLWKPSS